jgi:hypothetical protein
VFTATQPGGVRGSAGFARFAIVATLQTAIPVQRGQTASAPVKAVHNNNPHQLMAGKKMPAANTGEAKPITPSGGMIVRTTPNGPRQSACSASAHHTNGQGRASSADGTIQSTTASRGDTAGPKKLFAPGTSGHSAAQY